ncbi:MAG: YdcF family protein [Acidobacteriota bacterium]
MDRALRRIVEVLVLPPAGPLWLALLGAILLVTRWRRAGRWAIGLGLAALFLLSTPLVEGWLMASVDSHPPLPAEGGWPGAEAIVVLGAGVQWGSREWGYDAPSSMAVARLRYAAEISRRTELPILVTGYTGGGMKAVMEGDFGRAVRWVEDQSYDTWENALNSATLLRARDGAPPIRRIYLVTHFWHMPRSVLAFEAAGFDPVPAPMGFSGPAPHATWLDGLRPQPSALLTAKFVVREWIGLVWYRWLAFRGEGGDEGSGEEPAP